MKTAVIGGGVAGLSAAYRLLQAGHEVALFEAEPQLGGLVRSFDPSTALGTGGGGEPLECFYHHLFTTDTTIVSLINELGLGERLVWRDSKVGFFHGGRIWPFVTPLDLLRFRPLPIIDRVRLGLAGLYLRRQDDWHRYESVTAWRSSGGRSCAARSETRRRRSRWPGSGVRSTSVSRRAGPA